MNRKPLRYLVYSSTVITLIMLSIYLVYPDFYTFLMEGPRIEVKGYELPLSQPTIVAIDVYEDSVYMAVSAPSYNGSEVAHILYVYRLSDGESNLIWRTSLDGWVEYLDLEDGYIVVSYGGLEARKVDVYNLEGDLKFYFDLGSESILDTWIRDDYLYIESIESIRKRVYIVNLDIGELVETIKHPSSIGIRWLYISGKTYVFNPPFETPGVYIFSENGLRRILEGYVEDYKVVHDSYLILIISHPTEEYEVVGIDIQSSQVVWSRSLGTHNNLVLSGYSLFELYFTAYDWIGSGIKTTLYVLKIVDGSMVFDEPIEVTDLSIYSVWGLSGYKVILGRYENMSGIYIVALEDGGYEIVGRHTFNGSTFILLDASWDRGMLALALIDSVVEGNLQIVKVYRRVI